MPDLPTVDDVATRWGLAEDDAKHAVLAQGLPFIRFGESTQRIRWTRVRFRLESIQRWEEEREASLRPPVGRTPATTAYAPSEASSRLGDWRGQARAKLQHGSGVRKLLSEHDELQDASRQAFGHDRQPGCV